MALIDLELLAGQWGLPATVVAGLIVLLAFLYMAGGQKVHPNEPTVLAPKIPFVGHLVGMAMQGGKYVKHLG